MKFLLLFLSILAFAFSSRKFRRDADQATENYADYWDPPEFPTLKEDMNLKCDQNCKIAYDRCDALYKKEFMLFCQSCCMPAPNTRCQLSEMENEDCRPDRFNPMMETPNNGGIKGYILQKQYERDRLYRNGYWVSVDKTKNKKKKP